MKPALLLAACLAACSTHAFAQRAEGGNDNRWNITGPNWYETPCGHTGFSVTHGLPYTGWRQPCSVPIRVCEYKRTTVSFPADPDMPCDKMVRPEPEGGLQRTYLKTWN